MLHGLVAMDASLLSHWKKHIFQSPFLAGIYVRYHFFFFDGLIGSVAHSDMKPVLALFQCAGPAALEIHHA
jgi:hypothetical protein